VTVRTSDIRGAGTDARVSIQIFGSGPSAEGSSGGPGLDSGLHVLDNSANNFERGAADTFLVSCQDLGPLTRVMVRASLLSNDIASCMSQCIDVLMVSTLENVLLATVLV
jgi:hypothetical protein